MIEADDRRAPAAIESMADRLRPMEGWHFWSVGRDELVFALLRRASGSGTVVDVGCGTGAFAARMRDSGFAAVALDRSLAAEDLDVPGAVGDAEALPLRGGSVGTMVARDVLEHVDDRRALAECHRALRPGGLLIVLVPAWPALWSARDERAGHLRRYTRSSLRRVIVQSGFHLLELRGYQFALLPLVAASRLVARRRPAETLQAEERPSPRLNALLARVNRAEVQWTRHDWFRPPTGSTLAAVARRP